MGEQRDSDRPGVDKKRRAPSGGKPADFRFLFSSGRREQVPPDVYKKERSS